MLQNEGKLRFVADALGMDLMRMLEGAATDSVSPGICLNCDAVIEEIEPDQTRGYCEACGANKIVSVLVLAGMI